RLLQTWLQQNSAPQAVGRVAQPPAGEFREAQSLAIQLRSQREPGPESKDATLVSNAGNRRGKWRFACKLGAEVYRLGSDVPNRCTLSDISEGGCYVEMPTPLSAQSGVEILVRTADTKFRI